MQPFRPLHPSIICVHLRASVDTHILFSAPLRLRVSACGSSPCSTSPSSSTESPQASPRSSLAKKRISFSPIFLSQPQMNTDKHRFPQPLIHPCISLCIHGSRVLFFAAPVIHLCVFVPIRGLPAFFSTAFASLHLPTPSSVDHLCPSACICGYPYSPLRAPASPRLCVKLIPPRIPRYPPENCGVVDGHLFVMILI